MGTVADGECLHFLGILGAVGRGGGGGGSTVDVLIFA